MTGIMFRSLTELCSNLVIMTIASRLNYEIYMFCYPSHKCKLTLDVDCNKTFMKNLNRTNLVASNKV